MVRNDLDAGGLHFDGADFLDDGFLNDGRPSPLGERSRKTRAYAHVAVRSGGPLRGPVSSPRGGRFVHTEVQCRVVRIHNGDSNACRLIPRRSVASVWPRGPRTELLFFLVFFKNVSHRRLWGSSAREIERHHDRCALCTSMQVPVRHVVRSCSTVQLFPVRCTQRRCLQTHSIIQIHERSRVVVCWTERAGLIEGRRVELDTRLWSSAGVVWLIVPAKNCIQIGLCRGRLRWRGVYQRDRKRNVEEPIAFRPCSCCSSDRLRVWRNLA